MLYIGVTNDVVRRVFEHKVKRNKRFTYKYNVSKLVYYEEFGWINEAIRREKRLKKYNRQWKIDMINKVNPYWNDLSAGWYALTL